MLHAAAMYWHQKSGKGPLKVLPLVAKPPAPAERTRWLTRPEAAQFLWHGVRKLKPGQRKRLFRFFIIGWYTGTRHTAIGGISWKMADLESQVLYRRPEGAAETRKRRPPVRIGRRLLSHLRRWKRLDGANARFVLEYGGGPVLDNGSAWRAARVLAKLSPDVTPHTLRHSRATHMMRQRVNPWEAARSLGMSLAMLENNYGHHHPDWQSEAAEAK
jgi:integrase